MGFNGEETSWQESLECKSTESASVLGLYANVRPYVFMVAILREFQANRTSAKRESTSNMPLLMKRSRRLMSTMSRM